MYSTLHVFELITLYEVCSALCTFASFGWNVMHTLDAYGLMYFVSDKVYLRDKEHG